MTFTGKYNDQTVRLEGDIYMFSGQTAAGILNEGVYDVSDSDFTGNKIYNASAYLTVPGGQASQMASGSMTVTHVEGGYNLVFDITNVNGENLKAKYTGTITGVSNPM